MQKWIQFFDKGLYLLLAAVLIVGAVAQVGLRNEDTRAVLTSVDVYEGAVLSEIPEKALPTMTLELLGGEPDREIQVLLNGEVVGDFSKSVLVVPLTEGGLLEINAARTKGPVLVKVLDCSPSLIPDLKGKLLQVDRAIETLGNIEIDG